MDERTKWRNGILRQELPLCGEMQRKQENRNEPGAQRRENTVKQSRPQIEIPGIPFRHQGTAKQVDDENDAEKFQTSGMEREATRRGESPQEKFGDSPERFRRILQPFRRRRAENLRDASTQECVNSHQ